MQQSGFKILLAAPQNFAALSQEQGVPFHPLRGDAQEIMAGETGRKFMERSGANPILSILTMRNRETITAELTAGGFLVTSVWSDLVGTPFTEDSGWIGIVAQTD